MGASVSPQHDSIENQNTTFEEARARVAIVGGGLTGGAIFNQTVHEYIRQLSDDLEGTPPLTIDFYEAGGQYAYGTPYDLEYPVFHLNQPASRMSIYPDDPGHFAAWVRSKYATLSITKVAESKAEYAAARNAGLSDAQIARTYPESYIVASQWGNDDFVPRIFYGGYLKDEFEAVRHTAEQVNAELGREAIRINLHDSFVTNVEADAEGSIRITSEEASRPQEIAQGVSDSLVIATGHHKNPLFQQYRGHADYADSPFTMQEIENIIGEDLNPKKPVFIIGTSQSMLDAMAGLEAIGFKGPIIAASTNAVEPWPYVPSLHRAERTDYTFHHLTPAAITELMEAYGENVPMIVDGIRALLVQELHSAEALEQGPRHVLTTLRAGRPDLEKLMQPCPGLLENCDDLIDQFDGNHTFAGRFESYCALKESGQLRILRGRVDVNKTHANEDGGFTVAVKDKVSGEEYELQSSKLFNCASMQRAPFRVDRQTG